MFKKILVANDGSPGAFKALAASFNVAEHYHGELHMIIVEELPRFPASIDEVAEEKDEANHRFAPVIAAAEAQASAAGVTIETHLVPGHVVDAVIGPSALWATRNSTSGSSAAPPTGSSAWRPARCWS